MVGRGRHQHNEINAAFRRVREIPTLTVVESHNGHRWGWVRCICGATPFKVWSTPRNAGNHAKAVVAWAIGHARCGKSEEES
ncbi:hypothetical protein FHU36_001833 [Nonomuraea muscovyensis]|uniref:Uncharacterized protein n=1 Tax=Nonomuraea muscovyensis TaxID=1124761 RepID=A0A7X0BYN6_9ACTN|nr:hypothetical protein [Nonomuraea muscovyensis]